MPRADATPVASLSGGILGLRLKGKSGDIVFVNVDGETRVRRRVVPHNPQTPAQQANRAVQTRATRAWSLLPAEARARWSAWAAARGGKGQTTFVALYGKMLRVDPLAPPPQGPPARPFFGDAANVTATAAASAARFASDAPNRAGVVTELLVQPLASAARRTYRDKYRHADYVAFAPGHLARDVPCAPGVAALAYRFVEAATGQATELVELGVVTVG